MTINRVRGDLLPVIITAAFALACYPAVSQLVRMIWGRLKDFLSNNNNGELSSGSSRGKRKGGLPESAIKRKPRNKLRRIRCLSDGSHSLLFLFATGYDKMGLSSDGGSRMSRAEKYVIIHPNDSLTQKRWVMVRKDKLG